MFFDDNFSKENSQLLLLNDRNSKEEIENWVNKITCRFVMKFDSEFETENDFIYDYLEKRCSIPILNSTISFFYFPNVLLIQSFFHTAIGKFESQH